MLLHAGTEGYRLPSPNTTRICRALVEAGASAVVCATPMCPAASRYTRGASSPMAPATSSSTPSGSRVPDDWYRGSCVSMSIGRGGVWRFMLVPYRQRASLGAVEPLSGASAKELMRETLGLSLTIGDEERLAGRWTEFCRAGRESSLGHAGLSRVERRLLRRGVWPFWRLSRQRLPELLNVIRCESHRERLSTVLQLECDALERDEEYRRRRDPRLTACGAGCPSVNRSCRRRMM